MGSYEMPELHAETPVVRELSACSQPVDPSRLRVSELLATARRDGNIRITPAELSGSNCKREHLKEIV